jgi:hypothetical protein
MLVRVLFAAKGGLSGLTRVNPLSLKNRKNLINIEFLWGLNFSKLVKVVPTGLHLIGWNPLA